MASVIKAGNATDGIAISSDNTGILELKTGTGAGTTAVTIGTDQSVTFAGAVSSSGNQTVTGNLTVDGNTTLGNANTDTILMTAAPSIGGAGLGMGFGFRNRIINGGMRIDQRNAGAAATTVNDSTSFYTLDRWRCSGQPTDGVFTVQQDSSAPAGFNNSAKVTITTADASVGATQAYMFQQRLEGFTIADLGWGAAGAASVTLSFWVRSSLTGTFGGAIANADQNRNYPFTYTISAANTWEQKTVTIPGDTTGTWVTTNASALLLTFQIGAGTDRASAAGSWNSTANASFGATGATQIISTLNATWFITGVQLEKGSTATSFDYRPYGTELQLCQRYYWNMVSTGAPYMPFGGVGSAGGTVGAYIPFSFPVPMRTVPAVSATTGSGLVLSNDGIGAVAIATTTVSLLYTGHNTNVQVVFDTAGGLTANRPYSLYAYNSTTRSVAFSAEL